MNRPIARRRRADSIAAEQAFRDRVALLGGRVVGSYLNNHTAVEVTCREGHRGSPRPGHVRQGVGICRVCAGCDPGAAEAKFRTRVADLGGRVVGEYVKGGTPVACVCAQGHPCRPTPLALAWAGICLVCAGKCPRVAEAKFRARLAELGGRMVGEYVNAGTPVACVCGLGHPCMPWPNSVTQGQGICRTCVGLDPATAEAAFRARIAEMGGRIVGKYEGKDRPVECLCPEGHACRPSPGSIRQGRGMCPQCAGKTWDVAYVVGSPTAVRIKLGITSGDPRDRLAVHRRAGYSEVIRLVVDLPDAAALERNILTTLRTAGISSVKGREYYDRSALAVVLDVVDGWTRP